MGPTKINPEDQQFNIQFVSEVKKHPCLFDSNSTEYKQAQVQDKAWQEVSGNVRESVDLCKKRWRNLRCCMTRYLKSVRDNIDSSSNLRRKPYYLYSHMQFVVPYLKMKDGEGAMCETTEEAVWVKSSHSGELLKTDEEVEEEIEAIDVAEEDQHQIKQSIIQSIKIVPMSTGQEQQSQETTTTTYEIIEAPPPAKQPRIEQVHQVTMAANQLTATPKKDPLMKHFTYVHTPSAVNTATLYSSTPIASTGTSAASSANILRQQTSPLQATTVAGGGGGQQLAASNAASDADNNFFKSLIPDIQSMNMDQKRKLKIGILRLIDEILSTT